MSSPRKVIITKIRNLVSERELRNHRRVGVLWDLPRDYKLLELRDPDAASSGNASRRMAVAAFDEGALFAPFYSRVRSLAEIMTFAVTFPTVSYHLITDFNSVQRWPQLTFSKDWEISSIFHVRCQLSERSADDSLLARSSMLKWAQSMKDAKSLRRFNFVWSDVCDYIAVCELAGPGGDAGMGLFMVLADALAARQLLSVAFRPPTPEDGEKRDMGQATSDRQRPSSAAQPSKKTKSTHRHL